MRLGVDRCVGICALLVCGACLSVVAASTATASVIRGVPSAAGLPAQHPMPAPSHRADAVTLPGGRVLTMDSRTVRSPMPHVLFGTIVDLHGTSVLIRTRAGNVRSIDASPAFAAGTVSLPLFAGKTVAIDGVIAADGTLTAARITRMTRLSAANRDK